VRGDGGLQSDELAVPGTSIRISGPRFDMVLRCMETQDGSVRWSKDVSPTTVGLCVVGNRADLLERSGRVESRDLRTGKVLTTFTGPSCVVNGDIVPAPGGHVAAAGEAKLAMLDAKGVQRWAHTARGHKHLVPPATGVLRATSRGLLAATTDGRVTLFDFEKGETKWRVELGAAATAAGSNRTHAVLVCWDGSARAVSLAGGDLAWQFDQPVTRETVEPGAAACTAQHAAIYLPGSEAVFIVEMATGSLCTRIDAPGGAHVAAHEATLFVATTLGIEARRPE
jgi:outer membrane protein assembly factor BamB